MQNQCVNVANCQYQCCQLETGNWDWQQWQHFTPFRDACNAGVFVYRFRRFSCPPSGRARRVADKRRAADGLPSKPVRRDGRQSPQGDRPRRRLSWSRASAQCGRDARSPGLRLCRSPRSSKVQLSKIKTPKGLVAAPCGGSRPLGKRTRRAERVPRGQESGVRSQCLGVRK